ncbi:hypothetical protein AVEN_114436-1 [Araneus ventricosus]|uniref:Uncharacterized protein n=1 Tax=Araneus ventricosus TaxID=182803 RepID=A0A4Y2IIP5_ARAVE|nr:hypothetical protein AVEN_114436-1 [Araneus ventricosus]
MKSLYFPPYSKSSKEWEYAGGSSSFGWREEEKASRMSGDSVDEIRIVGDEGKKNKHLKKLGPFGDLRRKYLIVLHLMFSSSASKINRLRLLNAAIPLKDKQ